MLRAVFVQMVGSSVVDVPRCDTSLYELYVWWHSWWRRSRRQRVSSCWTWGQRECRWRLAGRGNWWRGLLLKKITTLLVAVNEDLDVQTHNERSSSSRDRRCECTSIVASELLQVSSQENFNAGALRQNVGKITIIHWKDPKVKKNSHRHHRCFLCSVAGPVKISTSGVAAGRQVVTAPGAFAFKPR